MDMWACVCMFVCASVHMHVYLCVHMYVCEHTDWSIELVRMVVVCAGASVSDSRHVVKKTLLLNWCSVEVEVLG